MVAVQKTAEKVSIQMEDYVKNVLLVSDLDDPELPSEKEVVNSGMGTTDIESKTDFDVKQGNTV